MRRSVLFILAWTLMAGGCARHETEVARGIRDQVLLIGNRDEPADLDPTINDAATTERILQALFEGLVNVGGDGTTIIPGVAERWEISHDGLTYTFHLRGNARWSNGAAVTSGDFLDTFMRALDPQLASETAGYSFPIRGARAFVEGRSTDPASVGIRAPDPRTLVVTLEHPSASFLTLLAGSPYFPVYMPSLDANGGRHQRGGPWERPGVLVSNGPFMLSEWRPNAYVSVKRNPDYWDAGRIRLNEVRFIPTDDEDGEERSFRAGQLHVTAHLPMSKVAVYAAGHPEELHINPSLRVVYLTFNVGRAPFTDRRVRSAFSLAIDRKQLVDAALGRLGTPAFTWVRPGTGGYTPRRGFRYDPAEARRQLAEAGYPGGAGLPPIEFTLSADGGVILQVAQVLQQMWAKNLGVQVSVAPMEFKAYLSASRERQFQLLVEGWGPIPDPGNVLEMGATGDPNNDATFSDRGYDDALLASQSAPTEVARWAAFDTMEAINAREVAYAPLYHVNVAFLVHPSVRGWRDNIIGRIQWRDLYLTR
jgi:oligopeptide transport system substrate-binding protein